MGIKANFTKNDIGRYLQKKLNAKRRALIDGLINIGEQAVNEARSNHRYENQTGNLQSSIGYCVLDNGKPVLEPSFNVVKNGAQGAQEGREFLHSLISEHSSGLALIVVAGMEYAAYVEAKNLNVLDSAEQLAERELKRMLKDLNWNK